MKNELREERKNMSKEEIKAMEKMIKLYEKKQASYNEYFSLLKQITTVDDGFLSIYEWTKMIHDDLKTMTYSFREDGSGTFSMAGMKEDITWKISGKKLIIVDINFKEVEIDYKIKGKKLYITDENSPDFGDAELVLKLR